MVSDALEIIVIDINDWRMELRRVNAPTPSSTDEPCGDREKKEHTATSV